MGKAGKLFVELGYHKVGTIFEEEEEDVRFGFTWLNVANGNSIVFDENVKDFWVHNLKGDEVILSDELRTAISEQLRELEDTL